MIETDIFSKEKLVALLTAFLEHEHTEFRIFRRLEDDDRVVAYIEPPHDPGYESDMEYYRLNSTTDELIEQPALHTYNTRIVLSRLTRNDKINSLLRE